MKRPSSIILHSSFFILHFSLAFSVFAKSPLASMPYTYVGRVLDYRGRTQGAADDIVIRAYNASGRLLAKTGTFVSDASPYNYRLAIPVASTAADGCAVMGEKLIFQVQVAKTTYDSLVPSGKDVVGAAGGICRADLTLSTDSDGDGVPNEYVDQISGYMEDQGYLCWDPNADWDGDGMSNAAEYRAGTNPFSADDVFRIKANQALGELDAGDFFALSFFANPGHTYGVKNTDTLGAEANWIYSAFRLEPSGEASERYYLTTENSSGETKTLYLNKDNASSGFYRLTVE